MFVSLFSPAVFADCGDTILSPGDDIKVKYHNNKYYKGSISKAWTDAGCKKDGHDKYWAPPHRAGMGCADRRKNGCSMEFKGVDFKHLFSDRDRNLMAPSCNLHDLCYSTKGPSKKTCDDELKSNLLSTYHRWHGSYSTDTVYKAVRSMGQSSYNKGPEWARKNKCEYP